MIKADKANKQPSERIKKRAAIMTVERLGPFEFRVRPGEEGKAVRIVRFHPDYWPPKKYKRVGDRSPDEEPQLREVFVECFAETTKVSCEANVHGVFCSHCQAAIKFLLDSHNADEVQPQLQ